MRHVELLDGGTGEELFRLGVPDDRKTWSAYALTHDEFHSTVVEVHRSYLEAGATYITTNNYSVTPAAHFSREDIQKYVKLAGRLARDAINSSPWTHPKHVCGSLPPLAESYRHDLVLPAADAIPLYTIIGDALYPYVDFFLAETMSSIDEARMAVEGVQHLGKPVFVSFTLRSDGALRSGESAVDALATLQAFTTPDIRGILFNCSEPEAITIALRSLPPWSTSSKQLRRGAYANALTPVPDGWEMDGAAPQPFRTDLSPKEYLRHVQEWVELGATLVGGCCAVGPSHIQVLHEAF
ncbi:hypothetical protein H310_00799 [Aphanomyces invadans]|uniref:Hcy-binding domain-containing protein n=1 Tax=Aphanomyces invadans TaxID=157072 RepID=A0A024UX44_9STRA|nr:hypothetical protein H310_00799 [Aphanomyces invadans]ETW10512.1 hypothetical protein H310_00799 [Aphanomyces invadans]|eukprot:XP_008861923.1 hypothetical protein H310_00799 [Aphanomyces invadans]